MNPPSTIEIESRTLKQALQGLSKLVPYRVRIPILGMVRVEVIKASSQGKPGVVALTTTDLDMWFTIRVAAHTAHLPKGEKTATTFLVPLKRLKEVVKTVRPKQPIDLWRLRLQPKEAVNPSDFPPPPSVSLRLKAIELSQGAIRDLTSAMLCCSKEEARHTLRGCYLNPANGGQIAATDGKHLVCFQAPYLSGHALKQPAIVPNHKIWTWKRLSQTDGDCPSSCLRITCSNASSSKSQKSGGTPIFRLDGAFNSEEANDTTTMSWTLIGCCIEGNYPNYAQVIPDQHRYMSRLDFRSKT